MRTLLVVVAAIILGACSHPTEQALPRGTRVLALGDSLTAGYGVNPGEAWPVLLASRTGWEIVNAGISGDTTAGGLQRLPVLLEEHSPALVIVSLGGNDMLRRVPQLETIANLNRILDLIHAHGAKTVLLATPKPSITGAVFNSLSAADFYQLIAESHKVPLIEDALPDVLSDPKLKVDALHPNAAGHLLLTEKLFKSLKAIGYVR
ncbi:MAG: arylesterase [Rhodocyclaceae bacterium]|nr:arylesterase [Rhodocyclaceae bacterium]MBP7081725.1 arylesterase [Rhodocyclaceae bacterium]